MTEGKFEKVQQSDKPLYGPKKLLLCGFPAKAHPLFGKVLEQAGLGQTGVVWVNESQAQKTLSDLLELSDNTGVGKDSALPRAVIVSGITENQLHTLMHACSQSGMKNALWAALTPTSETWEVAQLLKELQAEQVALSKRNPKQG